MCDCGDARESGEMQRKGGQIAARKGKIEQGRKPSAMVITEPLFSTSGRFHSTMASFLCLYSDFSSQAMSSMAM